MDVMTGTIQHRVLLNYRVAPEVLQRVLPHPLTPKLIEGYGVGGICQVSLSKMRPRGAPTALGTSSHNAAHRIAVVHENGEGVFVPRRDTSSRINQLSGGRIFPGLYNHSDFKVRSREGVFDITIQEGSSQLMHINASITDAVGSGSVFPTLAAASDFFRSGNIGWSPSADPQTLDTIELWTREWHMEPLDVHSEYSAYFSDESVFPRGTVEFDSGFVMRGLEHEWRAHEGLACVCS